MTPGDLATRLALLRVFMVERDPVHDCWGNVCFDHEMQEARQVDKAMLRAGFQYGAWSAAQVRAIDRAILETEALEDMGAVEVRP